jgi:hypothetical protein
MRIHGLVRFAAVNFFIGLAERTHAALHLLDEPEGYAALIATSPSAYRAFDAALGQGAVAVSDFSFAHGNSPHADIGASPQTIGAIAAGKRLARQGLRR